MARLQFYKPNPKSTGSACSFWCKAEDSAIFGSFIKQSGWNTQKKTGSFKANKENPNASTQFKFNQTEVCSILDTIETNRPFSAYHSTPKQVTKFNFKPYIKDGNQVGFSYSVNKEEKEDSTSKANFIIGLNYGEARLLKEYLVHSLASMFKAQDVEQANTSERAAKSRAEGGVEADRRDKTLDPPASVSPKPKPSTKPNLPDILDDEEEW